MMIIPIHTQSEEDKCPSCGKSEQIIEVCKNCGHEYADEELNFIDRCVVALIVIFTIWVMIILCNWLLFNFDNESLVEIIKGQWAWLKALRIF